jgi:hypothetical protein
MYRLLFAVPTSGSLTVLRMSAFIPSSIALRDATWRSNSSKRKHHDLPRQAQDTRKKKLDTKPNHTCPSPRRGFGRCSAPNAFASFHSPAKNVIVCQLSCFLFVFVPSLSGQMIAVDTGSGIKKAFPYPSRHPCGEETKRKKADIIRRSFSSSVFYQRKRAMHALSRQARD